MSGQIAPEVIMDQPTSGQLTELRWIAEFGSAHSSRQLDLVIAHGWAQRVDGQGRYGARLTEAGQAVVDAAAQPVELVQSDDPFAAFD